MTPMIAAFILPSMLDRWTDRDADRALRALRDFGVTAIATEADVYRDRFIEQVHAAGMQFIGAIACFSDHRHGNRVLAERPELHPILETGERRPSMEWYVGITPTDDDYRQSRLDQLERILDRHDLDGLWLDFIRWPLHWELELRRGAPAPLDSGFDARTIRRFLEYAGLELPPDAERVSQQARWILAVHRNRWTDFKCAVITDFVAQAASRIKAKRGTLATGLYLVPAAEDDRAALVGQRVRDLAPHVDYLSPMVYHAILHQPPEWAIGVVNDLVQRAPGQVVPVYQVDSAEGAVLGADFGPSLPAAEWQVLACDAAAREDLAGFVAFTGTALLADDRGAILRDCLMD